MRHTLDPKCECEDCEGDRFEHRAQAIIIAGLLALSALGWMAVRL